MKRLWILALLFGTSCGTYLGTEGVIYYGGLIAEGGQIVVGPEAVAAVTAGFFGGFAPYIAGAGGLVGILLSVFVTKRKKGK